MCFLIRTGFADKRCDPLALCFMNDLKGQWQIIPTETDLKQIRLFVICTYGSYFLQMYEMKKNVILDYIFYSLENDQITLSPLWSATSFNCIFIRNGFTNFRYSHFNHWSLEQCIFRSFSGETVAYYFLEQTTHTSSLPLT